MFPFYDVIIVPAPWLYPESRESGSTIIWVLQNKIRCFIISSLTWESGVGLFDLYRIMQWLDKVE